MDHSTSSPQFITRLPSCYPLQSTLESTTSEITGVQQQTKFLSSTTYEESILELNSTSPLTTSYSDTIPTTSIITQAVPVYETCEPTILPVLPYNTLPATPDPQGKPIVRYPGQKDLLHRSNTETRLNKRARFVQQHQEISVIKRRNRSVSITSESSVSSRLTYHTTSSGSTDPLPVENDCLFPTYQLWSYDLASPGFQGQFIPEFEVISPQEPSYSFARPAYTILPQYRVKKPISPIIKTRGSELELSVHIMDSPDGLLADYSSSSPTEATKQASGGFLRKLKWRFRRSLSPVNTSSVRETPVTEGLGIQNNDKIIEEDIQQKIDETSEERTGSSGGGVSAFNPFKKSKGRSRDTSSPAVPQGEEEAEYEDVYYEAVDHWASGDW